MKHVMVAYKLSVTGTPLGKHYCFKCSNDYQRGQALVVGSEQDPTIVYVVGMTYKPEHTKLATKTIKGEITWLTQQ